MRCMGTSSAGTADPYTCYLRGMRCERLLAGLQRKEKKRTGASADAARSPPSTDAAEAAGDGCAHVRVSVQMRYVRVRASYV